MSSKDYYEMLGVSRSARAEEIKKAYRRMAMKHHPDRNPGDKVSEQKFKEASEAYEVLSDPEKKSQYDQFGSVSGMGAAGGAGAGFDFGDIFGDVFGDIFGGARAGRGGSRRTGAGGAPGGMGGMGPMRGADLHHELDLSLEQAAFGTRFKATFPTKIKCSHCQGKGAKSDKTKSCGTCNGHGRVRRSDGFFAIEQVCPNCGGSGKVFVEPCATCRGEGRVATKRSFDIAIPKGVSDGYTLRMQGEGEAGVHGGVSGDLFIHVRLKPHHLFSLENGSHLLLEVPVSAMAAVVGGEVGVPTFDGVYQLKIPAGTVDGARLRIKGKGLKPAGSNNFGDMICVIRIELPRGLNRDQIHVLETLEDTLTPDNFPKGAKFHESLEEFERNRAKR